MEKRNIAFMKRITTLLLVLCVFSSCKKDDEDATKNVFYEISGPARYNVKIVDENQNILTFDNVSIGWNWQKLMDVGDIVAIEAKKVTMLDSNTIDFARLYISGELKQQVSDTGKVKTLSTWAKIE